MCPTVVMLAQLKINQINWRVHCSLKLISASKMAFGNSNVVCFFLCISYHFFCVWCALHALSELGFLHFFALVNWMALFFKLFNAKDVEFKWNHNGCAMQTHSCLNFWPLRFGFFGTKTFFYSLCVQKCERKWEFFLLHVCVCV